MQTTEAPRPPNAFFMLNLVSTALLALGLIGLFAPELLAAAPGLTQRPVAGTLVGIGLLFEGWSVFILISHLKRHAKRGEVNP